jgi:hypothetical protein
MATTWTISIDWARNGNYTDTYDDVTSRTISCDWFLGTRKAYQDNADNSNLELILDNTDKCYSPENGISPLYGSVVPFRPVRVQSNDGTHTVLNPAFVAGSQVSLEVQVGNNTTPTGGDPKYTGEFIIESYKPMLDTGKAVTFEATLKPAIGAAPVWGTV